MKRPAVIKRLQVDDIVGYKRVIWEELDQDLNILLGRNGSGKTTILQILACVLSYYGGPEGSRHTEDLLTKTFPNSYLELDFSTGQKIRVSLGEIRRFSGQREGAMPLHVLQFIENRKPKNRIGDSRNELRQHPSVRYENTVSEIKALLRSDSQGYAIAEEALAICKEIPALGTVSDWNWNERTIKLRGKTQACPLSCGQFDMLAFALDLVKLQKSLQTTDPVVILIDNPEIYLHPAALDPLLTLIRQRIPQGQIFISSHSLKLLCHPDPKCIFWLSRELRNSEGEVGIKNVRELDEGSKDVFFDLYGHDTSSAVLELLYTFKSPAYYKFLCECALPCAPVLRKEPHRDPQMRSVLDELKNRPSRWTLFDYGAGHGDLLEALLIRNHTDHGTTYIAFDTEHSDILEQRIREAKLLGKISSSSRVVEDLREAPDNCDSIVLCNVNHAILLPDLPVLLAQLINHHLNRSRYSSLVIHELETLLTGEVMFLVWTSEDYQNIFKGIKGFEVLNASNIPGGPPLTTTLIGRLPYQEIYSNLESILIDRFLKHLPVRKNVCLNEIEEIRKNDKAATEQASGRKKHFVQRRLAFLIAQIATICYLERKLAIR